MSHTAESVLNDGAAKVKALRTGCDGLAQDPAGALGGMVYTLKALESELKEVGFTHFMGLVSEFAAAITEIEATYHELKGQHKPDEAFVLGFFMNDAIQCVDKYFEALRKTGADAPNLAKDRMPFIKVLSTWRPSAVEGHAAPESAPEIPPEEQAKEQAAEQPAVAQEAAPVPLPVPVAEAASLAKTEEPLKEVSTQPEIRPETRPETEPAVNQRHQYLICRSSLPVSGRSRPFRTFAIPVGQVLEVIDAQQVNALPFPRPGVAGILNFRGDPLPVLVCQDRGTAAASEKDYIVIAKIEHQIFGFQMEQVLNVADLNPVDFKAPTQFHRQSDRSWVTHLIQQDDEILMIMDLKKALAA